MKKNKDKIEFPFPVFITKEGKWFVTECSLLGIATQGKTETEVKENIKDLIEEYMGDHDTKKPNLIYSYILFCKFGIISAPPYWRYTMV